MSVCEQTIENTLIEFARAYKEFSRAGREAGGRWSRMRGVVRVVRIVIRVIGVIGVGMGMAMSMVVTE